MGNGSAAKSRTTPVELVISELGGVPGCKAYHSSILLGGTEYFFDDQGIVSSASLVSHESRPVQRLSMGLTKVLGSEMQEQLAPHFRAGDYDLLRKNCNSFSDAALHVLLDQRLDARYRQLEKVGTRFPHLVARLSSGAYVANPRADGFDLDVLCTDLRFGPAWATQGHTVDGEKARRSDSTQTGPCKKGAQRPLVRVRILPFKDTFELNFDHMTRSYVLPHVRSPAIADPGTGRGLRAGDEFSAKGGCVRFRVVACEPVEGGLPTDATVVLCEGDPIERVLLKSVTMLPFESSMPLLKGKGPRDLLQEFVGPYLEQHSADLVVGKVHEIRGAKFKVVRTEPSSGGGAHVDAEIITTGLPVQICSVGVCEAAPAAQCREKSCKCWVCSKHAVEIQELSCLCPAHAPAQTGFFRRGAVR